MSVSWDLRDLKSGPSPWWNSWTTANSDFGKLPIISLKRTIQPQDSGLKGVDDTTSGVVAELGAQRIAAK